MIKPGFFKMCEAELIDDGTHWKTLVYVRAEDAIVGSRIFIKSGSKPRRSWKIVGVKKKNYTADGLAKLMSGWAVHTIVTKS